MRVLVAGASGVVGRQLMPLLSSVGHEPIGLSRGTGGGSPVRWTTGQAVCADALDAPSLTRVVRDARPDAVVNLLTAIPANIRPRHMTSDFRMTNRLRTEGTRNLLAAASAAGARRYVAEGLAYAYDPHGAAYANEDDQLWIDPPKQFGPVLAALVELEKLTQKANGLVLRLGHLYGPGSIYAADGSFTRQIRAGRVPLVGAGTSTFSFTHSHDAASAIVAALDKDVTGVLNIVDDKPEQVNVWLPAVAQMLGAKPPRRIPAGIARLAVGEWGVAFMTQLRGADNSRARLTLDWRPRFTSWRAGFADLVTAGGSATVAPDELDIDDHRR